MKTMGGSVVSGLWRYRSFIFGNVAREFHGKYLGSLLGALWSILSPLAMIVIYTIIFSNVMRARLPGVDDTMAFGVFLVAGILPWGYFTEIITRTLTMFVAQANLLKKSVFPRSCLPAISVLSATVNFLIIFGIFIVFLIISGRFPGLVMLAFIPLLLIQMMFALGLGLLLGIMNVFFRDIGHFTGIVLQFWFWFTPIVYPSTILPQPVKSLIQTWNPITQLVLGYQNIVLKGSYPVWIDYAPLATVSLSLLFVGYIVFQKLSGEIVDEL